jgi:copper chaperone CopZ
MKTKTILVALALLLGSIFTQAQFSSANLTAAGLTCALCTRAIYNALEKLPSVSKVEADIRNSAFNVTFKENASVDPDALKRAVEDAGFSVAQLKLNGQFGNITLGKDTHLTIGGKVFHFVGAGGKSLHGHASVKLVDKDFVSAKEFKRYKASTTYTCIETGMAANHCATDGIAHSGRIYHVTL